MRFVLEDHFQKLGSLLMQSETRMEKTGFRSIGCFSDWIVNGYPSYRPSDRISYAVFVFFWRPGDPWCKWVSFAWPLHCCWKKKGRVDGSRFQTAYSSRNARGVREVFILQHLCPASHTYMLMSRFFLERSVSFTRGALSSISSSRPSRRWVSSTVNCCENYTQDAGFLRQFSLLRKLYGQRSSLLAKGHHRYRTLRPSGAVTCCWRT